MSVRTPAALCLKLLACSAWLGCSQTPAGDGAMTGAPPPIAGSSAGAGGAGASGAGAGSAGVAGSTPIDSGAAGSAGSAGSSTAGSGGAGGAGAAGAGAGGAGAGAGDGAGGAGAGGAGGAAAPEPCPPIPALSPGDRNATIDIGGTTRSYIVHVPPGYSGTERVPLLLDFHPLTSDGDFQRGNSGYAEIADREGFIVVYADGIDRAWNIGPCCTRSRDVDDLGLALALVERMKGEACIDPKRVYAAGYSMGGGMSHLLACKAADVFAAVAPAAFDLIEEIDCQPSRPISVHAFRGTADFIVPYSGGASTPPTAYPLDPIHFLGAVGTFEKWAELNQCTGTPTMGSGGCQTYTTCAAGVEVTLCTTQGGGHVTGDAEVGWAALSKHVLP